MRMYRLLFWLAPWNPDDEETPCSCYLTGTTFPWNNNITGEQRLPDCPLKLIGKKKKKRNKRKWHGTRFTNGTRTGAEETTPI